MNTMNDNKKEKIGKDPVVTACSLIAIVVQSIIIICGYMYRWDWLAWECAAVLIIPAVVILIYGVKAIIEADKMMTANLKEIEEGSNGEVENQQA